MKRMWLSGIWMLLFVYGFGQQDINNTDIGLRLHTMAYGDSIRIMWIPGNEQIWEKGINKGYQLKRRTIRENNRLLTEKEQQTSEVNLGSFGCMNQEEWMETLDTSNQWEVLAAGMLYGEMGEEKANSALDLAFYLDKEAEKENRYAFNMIAINHSFIAAEKMGLAYTDKEVETGMSYLYTITLNDNDPKIEDQNIVLDNRIKDLPRIDTFIGENIEKGIILSWDARYLTDAYISYEVERKDKLSDEFTMINTSPIIGAISQDRVTFLNNNVMDGERYFYRIRGISPFGRKGPYADEISIERIQPVNLHKPIFNQLSVNGDTTFFGWEYPEEYIRYIEGYNIYYSESYDGIFRLVNLEPLPGSAAAFNTVANFSSGYFYIEAIGIDGLRYASSKRLLNPEDITPPMVPIEIRCDLDTINSTIKISWTENNEDDLLGYRLYYGAFEKDNYADISGGVVEDHVFILPVKSNGNGESLFFKVAAVDQRYNNSPLSDYCRVELPDITPPAPPLIRKVNNGDTSIVLEWAISPAYDVVAHRVERAMEGDVNWTHLKVTEDLEEIQLFTDSGIEGETTYDYRIVAIDRGGNESVSEVRKGRMNDNKLKRDISDYSVEEIEEELILQWKYIPVSQLDRIIIYRSVEGRDLITYRTLKGDLLNSCADGQYYKYTDDKAALGKKYGYALRAVWKDGGTSKMTKVLEIELDGK